MKTKTIVVGILIGMFLLINSVSAVELLSLNETELNSMKILDDFNPPSDLVGGTDVPFRQVNLSELLDKYPDVVGGTDVPLRIPLQLEANDEQTSNETLEEQKEENTSDEKTIHETNNKTGHSKENFIGFIVICLGPVFGTLTFLFIIVYNSTDNKRNADSNRG